MAVTSLDQWATPMTTAQSVVGLREPIGNIRTSRLFVDYRRRALEDAIERALEALDALDGDPDLETADDDLEDVCEDEGADESDCGYGPLSGGQGL